jgi:hypothetical protein
MDVIVNHNYYKWERETARQNHHSFNSQHRAKTTLSDHIIGNSTESAHQYNDKMNQIKGIIEKLFLTHKLPSRVACD